MKWALIIYFFVAGPAGGWVEVDRTSYASKTECHAHAENLNKFGIDGRYLARCRQQ